LYDHNLRKIFGFEFPQHLDSDKILQLRPVFGEDKSDISSLDFVNQSKFIMSNFYFLEPIFNNDSNRFTGLDYIKGWYDLFLNKGLFNSINLIQESFIINNRLFGSSSYIEYLDIAMEILLLVSGLEGLFTLNTQGNTDLCFKFKTIGALLYEKNVTNDFLCKLDNVPPHKLSFCQIQTLLLFLYELRSDIAHGSYKKFLEYKEWKKILNLLEINTDERNFNGNLSNRIPLTLGILQKQFFALIVQSKNDLTKGGKIIDEIVQIGNKNGKKKDFIDSLHKSYRVINHSK
ncbi:MAG: hypothetical protein Q8R87_08645, partial [Anaerolineaceae bacterium]|nr:hypothetical protein [Anaerolineaceae bacterium]